MFIVKINTSGEALESNQIALVLLYRFFIKVNIKRDNKQIENKSPNGSINDLLENYKFSLQVFNHSQKTVDRYVEILQMYFDFLASNKLMKQIGDLGTH